MLCRDYLRRGCFKVTKRHSWDFLNCCLGDWKKFSSCLPCLVSQRTLLLRGCWGNNLCQSLPQWWTGSNTTLTETPSFPPSPWLESQGVISSYFIFYLNGLLTVSMKDVFLIYHWHSFRYFQKLTHVMYKCNNKEKTPTWLLKNLDYLFTVGFACSLNAKNPVSWDVSQ